MIFVLNNLKYDTEKMELVSDKCKYSYDQQLFYRIITWEGQPVKLWRSVNNRWMITFDRGAVMTAIALSENQAKNLLLEYDWEAYEKIFGELEEA